MIRSIVILLVLISSITVKSQDNGLTQSIKGTVLDKQSQFPLIGVNVICNVGDEFVGTTSDIDGIFILENIPTGRNTISFSFIGYEDVIITNVLVNSAKETQLNIEMIEKVNDLEELVITADGEKHKAINEMATVSVRTLSVEEMSRFSGTISDPARMAQSYAGVSGASDDRNDIIIRGNSPTGVIWRMEGVDILSPNHFATIGTTGGPVSMLNINNLRNSDFITSAFPAEYGNGTSGVFDLKLRNGNTDKYEFIGQIGFNGFELGSEGPLGVGKSASYMANFRYSTLEVFDKLGFDLGVGSAVPEYKDLTFKVNLPTEKWGKFSVWGVGGYSNIDFLPDGDTNNLFTDDNEETHVVSNTGFGGLSHTFFFDNNTFSKIDLVVAANENNVVSDTLGMDGERVRFFARNLTNQKYSVNWKLNKKINVKNTISVGFIFDHYVFDFRDSTRFDNDIFDEVVNFDGTMNVSREYVQWQHRFNDKLTMNVGVHAIQLHLNDTYSIEPRWGVKYKKDEKNSYNLGFGLHSQLQPLPVYFQSRLDQFGNNILPNKNLDMFKSVHSVVGWDHLLNKNLRIKLESYYQYLYDVAVDQESSNFSMINSGADFTFPDRVGLDNDGTGFNYGIEMTVEKFFEKQYYYLLTASFFDSKYKGSDGVSRNTLYNGNYVINALGGKEINVSNNMILTLDSKFTYAGGRRYTPIDLEESIRLKDEVLFEDQTYEEQYDPYLRIDFKIGIRHNAKGFSQSFSVDLQNITNRKNVFLSEFDESDGRVETTYQRGFFPDVRYQIWF